MLAKSKLLIYLGVIFVIVLGVSGGLLAQDTPSLTVTPDEVVVGESLTIEVSGLDAAASVAFDVIYVESAEVVFSTTKTADDSGLIAFTLYTSSSDVGGRYLVSAYTPEGRIIAQGLFSIVAESPPPVLTVTPTTAQQGETLAVTGEGFEAGAVVTLTFSHDGEPVFTTERTADENGRVRAIVNTSAGDVVGDYEVTASVGDEVTASASFAIIEPMRVINLITPESVMAGDRAVITIHGLDSGERVQVVVQQQELGDLLYSGNVVADEGGEAVLELNTENARGGVYEIRVATASEALASGTFTIEADDLDDGRFDDVTVTVEPPAGPRGTSHLITVGGLPANETVTLDIRLEGDSVFSAEVPSDENGVIEFPIISEETDALGVYDIVVVVNNEDVASATLTITADGAATDNGTTTSATVTITPSIGARGTIYQISVEGLEQGAYIVDVVFEDEIVFSGEYFAGDDGRMAFRLQSEETDPEGDYTLIVRTPDGEAVAQGVFTVEAGELITANLFISPQSAPLGSTHDIVVSNLPPESEVTLIIMLEGREVFRTARMTDENGTASFTIFTELTDPVGVYDIVILHDGRQVAQGNINVQEAQEPILGDSGEGADDAATDDRSPTDTTDQQAINEIRDGDRIEGELTDEQPAAHYRYEGRAGETITITLTSGDFDAYLQLFDANGSLIAEDDDGATHLNSRINITLEADGVYEIVAASVPYVRSDGERYSVGTFTLTLSSSDGEASDDGQSDLPIETSLFYDDVIRIGDTLEEQLLESAPRRVYAFNGEEGQTIVVSASAQFDTYLTLLDNTGRELTFNDDGGAGLNPLIGPYTLPYTGTYLIVIESFGSRVSGAPEYGGFSLSIITVEQRSISYSESIEGTFTMNLPLHSYRFTGAAGDVISFSLNSITADGVYIQVAAADRPSVILVSDDSTYRANISSAFVGPFELPHDGEYIVTIGAYLIEDVAYTARLERVELATLDFGDSVAVRFDADTSVSYFSFVAEAGDIITVTVDSGGDIDTALVLLDSFGQIWGEDDDGGAGFDPELFNIMLEDSGTYYLRLYSNAVGDSGTATLTLTRRDALSLDEGAQQVKLSQKTGSAVLSFSGNAGESVRVTFSLEEGAPFSEPNVVVTQNGNIIVTSTTSGASRIALDFTVPADGEVRLILSSYTLGMAVIDVSLEREP